MAFLRAQDCDEIQGYWLSPPLEAHRCHAFIRNWTPDALQTSAMMQPIAS